MLRKLAIRLFPAAALAAILILAPQTNAQGTMSRREAPPMPPVDANKCIIAGPVTISGISSFRIKRRAEDKAVERWENYVRKKYGPSFASWANTSRSQEREITCKEYDRAVGNVWTCQAKAVPCQG